jgi:hypothetical protein
MTDENISLLEKGNTIGYRVTKTSVIKAEGLFGINVFDNDTVDVIKPLAGQTVGFNVEE